MIADWVDSLVGLFSPRTQLQRMQARSVIKRSYTAGEPSRVSSGRKPKNQSADQEMLGPFGADVTRAWGRELVRNNSYAWGVVDTIVSSVVGCGINGLSTYETPEGDDIEGVNDARDATWNDWAEVCELNGKYTFSELQALALREMIEAGEVLVRVHRLSNKTSNGITRPVPLALELIEADRIAGEKDNFQLKRSRDGENRIVRGVELDKNNRVVAYWLYDDHPQAVYAYDRTPKRVPALEILHLFRRDRAGQNRGISWFAPVMSWLRDLGVYVDNELQASAVASCFTTAIKSTTPVGSLADPDGGSGEDSEGNKYDYLQPGMVMHLNPGEDVVGINPGRPNSAAEPWINLILRGIAVGTGLSFETVARNFSGVSYSSARTSMLEDRRRFRRIQDYLRLHLCQPVWDAFCDQAALASVLGFPTSSELLENRRKFAPVEWQTPEWEWVDPTSEQSAAQAAIDSFMSDYQTELGSRGRSWRTVFYQRAKEDKLRKRLGLLKEGEKQMEADVTAANVQAGAAQQGGTGEMAESSRLQWKRNLAGIEDTLQQLAAQTISEAKARAYLSMIGLAPSTIDALIIDAMDGTVDTPMEEVQPNGV
jgi:lambda family phage portal protein